MSIRPPTLEIDVDPDTGMITVEAIALDEAQMPPPPPVKRRPPPPEAIEAPKAALPAAADAEILAREAGALSERDAERAALLHGALAAHEVQRGDTQAAGRWLASAAALSRERWPKYALRRRLFAERAWDRALEVMRAELKLLGAPKERVALLLEIATIEEIARRDLPAAEQALKEAREIDPRHAGVLVALAGVHAAREQWEPMVSALASLAEASTDVRHRAMVKHFAAQLYELRLANTTSARASYQSALAEDDKNLAAALSFESFALTQGDWIELARTLTREADLIDEPRLVRRLCERAGDLYWERLGDAERAIEAFARATQAAPEAVTPLRKLAAVLESAGRWAELRDAYRTELAFSSDPEECADLQCRIGETIEVIGDAPDDAIAAYRAALVQVPNHLASLQSLGRLYRSMRRYTDLANMDLQLAERLSDPHRRAERYFSVGNLVELHLSDSAEAARLYARAHELHAGHREAFVALERLRWRGRQWGELVSLYEGQARVTTDPSLKRAYLRDASRLVWDHLGDPMRAESLLREVVAIEAADLGPALELHRIYELTQQWDALADALEKFVDRLRDPDDIVVTLQRAARIAEEQLGNEQRALALHERVLGLDAANEPSLRAIGQLHYRAGRWESVIDCYRRQLPIVETSDERAAISYRIGRIEERKLGHRDEAVAAYLAAIKECATFTPASRSLDRLLRRDWRWNELLKLLEERGANAKTAVERAEHHHARGAIFELHRRELPEAEEAYAQAVKDAPEHEAAVLALAQVLEAEGRWQGLEALLSEHLAQASGAPEQLALRCRLARLYHFRLDDASRARDCYRAVLAGGPAGANLALAELWATRVADGAEATVASLERLASLSSDAELAGRYRALAALRDEIASSQPSATAFLESAATSPGDPGVLDGVLRALDRTATQERGVSNQLPSVLQARARQTDSPGARTMLHLEAAYWYEHLGRAKDAALAFEEAATHTTDYLPALMGIRRLASASGQWTAVCTLLEHEAAVSVAPENRAQALLAAAELALSRLADADLALKYLNRLLEREPRNERAFQLASALLESLSDYPSLRQLLHTRAQSVEDVQDRATLLERRARIERDQLSDSLAAITTLKELLGLRPDDAQVYAWLAPLEEKHGWWQDAAERYRRIATLSQTPEDKRAAVVREAEIRERELGDRDGALALLEALALKDDDDGARMLAAQLCERMGKYAEARELYVQLAERATATDRVAPLLAYARVAQEGLKDASLAGQALRQAVDAAARDEATLTEVSAFAQQHGLVQIFVDAAEAALASSLSPQSLPLRLALASAYQDGLADRVRAEAQLKDAMMISAADVRPVMRLGALALADGRIQPSLEMYRRAEELAPFSPEPFHGLSAGYARLGSSDASRLLDEVAEQLSASSHVDGQRAATLGALDVLSVRRALTPEESATYFSLHSGGPIAEVALVLRTLDPVAAELLADVLDAQPRGELLAESHLLSMRCWGIAAGFGVEPLRVFIDPRAERARLVSDGRIAIALPGALVHSGAIGRLTFQVARLVGWIAQNGILCADIGLPALERLLRLVTGGGLDDDERALAKKFSRALPRKIRKELERLTPQQLPSLYEGARGFLTEMDRSLDRFAFVLTRDPSAVLADLGYRGAESASPRVRDLLRFVASDSCWRLYLRLQNG